VAEYVYDLREASQHLPEDNTPRTRGGELLYAGHATRLGRSGTLGWSANKPGLQQGDQAVNVGDFYNIIIRVPEREHWFLRGMLVETQRVSGTMTAVAASLHNWKSRSIYLHQLDTYESYNLNPTPARPPLGLEPFAYGERYWRQIAAERSVAVAASLRSLQWTFDKHVWQRHVYSREVLLFRVEVTATTAGAKALITPYLDLVRYPSSAEVIERLVQRDGAMRADITLASMIEVTRDRLALED
jgi:hypothetical protein